MKSAALDLDLHQIAHAVLEVEAEEDDTPVSVYIVSAGPANMHALTESRRRLGLPPVPVVDIASAWASTRIEANRAVAPELVDTINEYLTNRMGEEEVDGEFDFRIEGDQSEDFALYYTPGPDGPEEPADGDYVVKRKENDAHQALILEDDDASLVIAEKPSYDEIIEAIEDDMELKGVEANIWLAQGDKLFLIEFEEEEDDEDEDDEAGDLVEMMLLTPPPPGVTEIADILVTYRDDAGEQRTQVWPLRSNGTMSAPEDTAEHLAEIISHRSLSGRLGGNQKTTLKDFLDTINVGLRARAIGGVMHLPPRAQAMIHQLKDTLSSQAEPAEEDEDFEEEYEEEEYEEDSE